MIRQAISCDICAAEKKQTNHWFVAYEQDGELRVSGWSSRKRLRPGAKHLCGQICLHKLVDDFMARTLTAHAPQAAASDAVSETSEARSKIETRNKIKEQVVNTDTSLTSEAAFEDFESSARLIPTPAPAAATRPALRMPIELVTVPARPAVSPAVLPVVDDEPPRFASRNWRAAAWERERQRESRGDERQAETAARRRFN